MRFARTRTAWKRLSWAFRATVRWDAGGVMTPLKYLNEGEKPKEARKDLWQGHALVNVGTELGREMFGVEKKEHIWTIWFSMGACICLVLYLT